jgi:hypothetical protein
LAGSNSEQVRKDGCAYWLQQLKLEQQINRHFVSLLSSRLTRREDLSQLHATSDGSRVALDKQTPYLKTLQEHATGGEPEAYSALARNSCLNRRLVIISNARLGVARRWTQEGGLVCVLLGGGVPYILYPKGKNCTFIGESYVHA